MARSAIIHFFRRVNNGEKPGFPRFKPLHRFTGRGVEGNKTK
ncbi:MAG: hypothetical protein ACLFSI_05020 [Halorhodospira sp.]